MDKIEEAALAMRCVLLAVGPQDEAERRIGEPVKPFELDAVRAVLQSLLPPTKEMVEAGTQWLKTDGARNMTCEQHATDFFEIMIRAVLEGK